MERRRFTIALLLLCLQVHSQSKDGNIDFISPGKYVLHYESRPIYVTFEPDNYAESRHLFEPADLSEKERYNVLIAFKEQLDIIPDEVITKYLSFDLVPASLNDEKVHSFIVNNQFQLVIEVEKIQAGLSYSQSIKHSLTHGIGNMIYLQNSSSNATKTFTRYLQGFHMDHNDLKSGDPIFESGFVSLEAAGIGHKEYSVSNEFSELFAYLSCLESRERIKVFLDNNPESLLREKLFRFVTYLEEIIPTFDEEYFFNQPLFSKAKRSTGISDQIGLDLLASHELRSNETFDFTAANEEQEHQAIAYSIPYQRDLADDSEILKIPVESENEQEQIETLFNSKGKKKAKKSKKKKDGTGLLVVGSLVYLTLQLLSQ